jgi:aspartyl-tRNA(Asn)/glutamyl-tRNA(Gln) amidotransferase subunit B
LEEDAGKSIHDQDETLTLLDYNRAGVPLIEIVSEPDMHSAEEAAAYLTHIRKLVRWIGICDGNMEEGSLRCDANISIRPLGDKKLGTRVEVKNLNSIKHLKHAVEIEIERLSALSDRGEKIIQETRSYDADAGITFSIRTKEDADDYRYFPEPDLAPFAISDLFIGDIKAQLPALPDQCFRKYTTEYGLSPYDAEQLTEDRVLSDLYENAAGSTVHKKQLANMLIGPVRSFLNDESRTWEEIHISGVKWDILLTMIADGKLSFSQAVQKVVPLMLLNSSADPAQIASTMDLIQDADAGQIEHWVKQVLEAMPDKATEYKKGKKGLMGLFVGEVKKISKGKADPKLVTQLLEALLNEK